MKCPHCAFLENTFYENIQSNYEYWLFTEMFVYLHGEADHCMGVVMKRRFWKWVLRALVLILMTVAGIVIHRIVKSVIGKVFPDEETGFSMVPGHPEQIVIIKDELGKTV